VATPVERSESQKNGRRPRRRGDRPPPPPPGIQGIDNALKKGGGSYTLVTKKPLEPDPPTGTDLSSQRREGEKLTFLWGWGSRGEAGTITGREKTCDLQVFFPGAPASSKEGKKEAKVAFAGQE